MSKQLWLLPPALVFALGSAIWYATLPNLPALAIYDKPSDWMVVRSGKRVTYFAHGQKNDECDPIAAFTAVVYSAKDKELARRIVFRRDGSSSLARRPVPKDGAFFANGLFFKVNAKKVESGEYFKVEVRCELDDGEVVTADFGPMGFPAAESTLHAGRL